MCCTKRNINEEYPKNHKNITNGNTKKLVAINAATLGTPDDFFPEDEKSRNYFKELVTSNKIDSSNGLFTERSLNDYEKYSGISFSLIAILILIPINPMAVFTCAMSSSTITSA